MRQKIAAAIFVAAFFLAFNWRGLFIYFTGDDVANLYRYRSASVGALLKANLLFWSSYYRPWGGIIYRPYFAIFGFHPRPLVLFYYAVLLFNLWIAYAVLQRLSGSREIGLLATLLLSVHAHLRYLYYNTGVLYDVFCFTFYFGALWLYLTVRRRGEYLDWKATAGFLVLFICALNSKEMAATLPVIVLLYELLLHPPKSTVVRWLTHEGRIALISSLLLLAYIPGKLAPEGLTSSPAYIPRVTLPAWLESTEQYLAFVVYAPRPFTAIEVLLFYCALAIVALWLRSALLWFGLLFFIVTLLPVSFVSIRLGFVLYLPLAGLALYAAAILAKMRPQGPRHGFLFLFLATAACAAVVHARHWERADDPNASPIKATAEQFRNRLPDMHPGIRLLFVKDPFHNYELFFTLSALYNERELDITQLQDRPEPEVVDALKKHYDHIFTYDNGRYREMDHADAERSVRLNLLLDEKTGKPDGGEMLVVGRPDQDPYFVRDVIKGAPDANDYWTREAPELKFLLKPNIDYIYVLRFYLPGQTFEKTGPVTITYFINDHLLESARYDSPEQHEYRKPVPSEWLHPGEFTVVKMVVSIPYIDPKDGTKYGFLLQSAGFERRRQ